MARRRRILWTHSRFNWIYIALWRNHLNHFKLNPLSFKYLKILDWIWNSFRWFRLLGCSSDFFQGFHLFLLGNFIIKKGFQLSFDIFSGGGRLRLFGISFLITWLIFKILIRVCQISWSEFRSFCLLFQEKQNDSIRFSIFQDILLIFHWILWSKLRFFKILFIRAAIITTYF